MARKYLKGYSLPRNANVTCEGVRAAFANLNGFETLSDYKKIRLFLRLSKLRTSYDFRKAIHVAPTHGGATASLKDLIGSFNRIAKFGRAAFADGNENSAAFSGMSLLAGAGEAWAEKQNEDTLPWFFQPSRYEDEDEDFPVVNYGAWSVLRQFFETAELLGLWLKDDQESRSGNKEKQIDIGLNVWLIGDKLPKLFTTTTGRRYGISRDADGSVSGPGVRFVLAALEAMQVQPGDGEQFSGETLQSYRRRALDAHGAAVRKK